MTIIRFFSYKGQYSPYDFLSPDKTLVVEDIKANSIYLEFLEKLQVEHKFVISQMIGDRCIEWNINEKFTYVISFEYNVKQINDINDSEHKEFFEEFLS